VDAGPIGCPAAWWFGPMGRSGSDACGVFQEQMLETSLSAVWDEGQREAWFMISDQPACWRRVQTYSWRMRVESTFQDAKSRGWDLEVSLIADRERAFSFAAGAVCGNVVGDPSGCFLAPSGTA
jgi:hypothetical protein